MDTEFEWDPEKAESNLQKHGVSFAEAATVFFDLFSITVSDPLHSVEENRSPSLACPTSNVIWWWYTQIVVLEYESLARA